MITKYNRGSIKVTKSKVFQKGWISLTVWLDTFYHIAIE